MLRLVATRAANANRLAFTRAYSDGVIGGGAGATARSKGFSEREQAKEGQYIREMEAQKLRQLKEKAAAAAKEVEAQQKRMAENGDKAE